MPPTEPAVMFQVDCARCLREIGFPFDPQTDKVCDKCYQQLPSRGIPSPVEETTPGWDNTVRAYEEDR